jgi:hypothetical protein
VAWGGYTESPARICFRRWDGTAWTELGRSLEVGPPQDPALDERGAPSLALDPQGHPVVAWQAGTLRRSEIYLSRWNGTAWIELGGSASGRGVSRSGGACSYPLVALDGAGAPTLLWSLHGVAESRVFVSRWTGTEWKDLDSHLLAATIGASAIHEDYQPSLALDGSGRPVVAWLGGGWIRLKRWDGAAWVELGGSARDGLGGGADRVRAPSVAVDARGDPVVAWSWESEKNWEVALRRWTGSAWVELANSATGGGISRSSGHSRKPALRLDPDGNPVVAWTDGTPNRNQIYLRRFFEPAPSALRQLTAGAGAPIPPGGPTRGSSVTFRGRVNTAVPGALLRLEVELAAPGVTFAGVATARSEPAPAGSVVDVTVSDLAAGPRRWRARTVDSFGMVSPWVRFGSASERDPDFSVEARR